MAAQTPAPNFTDDSPGPPDDPLWQRAGRADAIDLAALAEREGATGLEAQLGRGGSAGRTALLALPFAPDAELAAGTLSAEQHAQARTELERRALEETATETATGSATATIAAPRSARRSTASTTTTGARRIPRRRMTSSPGSSA